MYCILQFVFDPLLHSWNPKTNRYDFIIFGLACFGVKSIILLFKVSSRAIKINRCLKSLTSLEAGKCLEVSISMLLTRIECSKNYTQNILFMHSSEFMWIPMHTVAIKTLYTSCPMDWECPTGMKYITERFFRYLRSAMPQLKIFFTLGVPLLNYSLLFGHSATLSEMVI